MTGYTKLFQSIVTSSVWCEDDQTRIVWITMLALANQHGEVHASLPGLARVAGVSLEAAQKAVETFLAPDPHSRTPDMEGRRIEAIEGGWHLVNHLKYRMMANKEDQQEQAAERMRRYRQRNGASHSVTERNKASRSVTDRNGASRVTKSDDIAEAEAEADTNTEEQSPPRSLSSSSVLQGAGGEDVTMSTEPPNGFPRSEAEAGDQSALAGVSAEFAVKTWTLAASRGWYDSKGQPIRSWRHYLATQWTYERERMAKQSTPAFGKPAAPKAKTAVTSTIEEANALLARFK